jgi:hypothetical protein
MGIDIDEAKVKRNEFGMWLEWTLATAAGMLLGFLPAYFISSELDLGLLLVILPLWTGFLVGLFQWITLRGFMARPADWIWTHCAAWSAGFAIGLLVIQFARNSPAWVAFSYLLFGLIVAILQWPLLRREVPNIIPWIVANVLGWALGFYLSQVALNLLFPGQEISQAFSTAFISTLSGLIAGAITGAALVWIVRQPEWQDFVEGGA